jgi:hypothetical protein
LTFEALLFVSPFSNFALVGGPFADLDLGTTIEFGTDDPTTTKMERQTELDAYGFMVGVAAYFDTR